ncbi:hypothetical protein [Parerythrobacter lacustris]|uniref:Uncharacterized protein n=1 Tax=Parerythrobacter lacustris TaxID=2969984 RepID=A0ABT1XTS2_9SPHN|nr:hypothetical protein [Parerythrobacter lacustris]MCR2834607.1 hypothetical protein [Parerythrobacter lacustris]
MELRLSKPREKWFFVIVLPIAIAIEWAFAQTLDWTAYPRSEWVALVDLCIFMPVLYLTLFSSELTPLARFLRSLGIAGIGLIVSGLIIPEANQFLVAELSSIRNLALIGILMFEGWILAKVISAVYRKNANAEALEREFAIPGWIARLMVLEARFWKAVWNLLRRK